ncbi:hypothetical protein J7E97_01385 [Streptomyces sp. ISL-66]|uniref:hypothetical protein n=1 Tax=Streptomyces sp. ISL-66 TaxID=2819186 RepID=UPI001BEA17AE|nr:hypothetical protein [Streptomyces sp. ISL-66]MBT2466548.1 hypothetical protein [Streptomyces sp. ISL-66]
MLIETAPAPTAGLLASLGVWFWIELTEVGHVAFLLLAHPPARRGGESVESIELSMQGLVSALTLAEPSAKLPDIGPRLVVHGRAAILSLDGCSFVMRVPVSAEWAEFVTAGAPVVIEVGLDPLQPMTPFDALRPYVSEGARHGRLFLGKTRAEPPRRFIGAGGPPI